MCYTFYATLIIIICQPLRSIYEWLELWDGSTRYGICECCVCCSHHNWEKLRDFPSFGRVVAECIISNKTVCFFAHFSAHTRIISFGTNHECASHYKYLVKCNLLGLCCGLCDRVWLTYICETSYTCSVWRQCNHEEIAHSREITERQIQRE